MNLELTKNNTNLFTFLWLSLVFIFLLSCKIPEESFENPLDVEANAAKGIYPPALIFSTDSLEIVSGEIVNIDLYALEIDSVTGAQIEIEYFDSSISIDSVSLGDFFVGDTNPIFIVENQTNKIIIYITYLGSNQSVSGTGIVASITLKSLIQGSTLVKVSTNSLLLDKFSNPIDIMGLGKVKINAR